MQELFNQPINVHSEYSFPVLKKRPKRIMPGSYPNTHVLDFLPAVTVKEKEWSTLLHHFILHCRIIYDG